MKSVQLKVPIYSKIRSLCQKVNEHIVDSFIIKGWLWKKISWNNSVLSDLEIYILSQVLSDLDPDPDWQPVCSHNFSNTELDGTFIIVNHSKINC